MTEAWYAVHVRSNQERQVASRLTDKNVPSFVPLYRTISQRRDRRVILQRPLFTGYVFARFDTSEANARVAILRAPGVVRIVGFGGELIAVPDATLESLRILAEQGEGIARPHPLVREGQKVEVIDGCFRGAVGVLHLTPGRKAKLLVEVEFLGRAVAVPISPEQVMPQG